jgi:cation transport ATPase
MNFRNIWNEFYSKVLPTFGLIAIFSIFSNLDGQINSVSLLRIYIFITVIYYLNWKILANYINMSEQKITMYVVYTIEFTIFVSVTNIWYGLQKHGSVDFWGLLRSFMLIVIFMTIGFLLQKIQTKRINKKLQEYKNQDDDDR